MNEHMSRQRIPFTPGPAFGSQAKVLLTHFHGGMDAGMAGRLAIAQLLRALPSQRVLTFDTDSLVDYRAHRPVLTIEEWVSTGMEVPQIAIDMVHDDAGTPLWILHGPEADLRWQALSETVLDLARQAGVELTVALHGMPSGVPHTRPVQVHAHATDPALLPEQPQMPSTMQVSTTLAGFLHMRLHEGGMEGLSLLPTVPFYLADMAFPPAASVMLSRLSDVTGLALPVGDLEQGSADDLAAIEALVEANPEIASTISQLEQSFDALDLMGRLPHIDREWPNGSLDDAAAMNRQVSQVSESVEAFLQNMSRLEDMSRSEESGELPDTLPTSDDAVGETSVESIEDVLRRIEERERRRAAGLAPLPHTPLRRRALAPNTEDTDTSASAQPPHNAD